MLAAPVVVDPFLQAQARLAHRSSLSTSPAAAAEHAPDEPSALAEGKDQMDEGEDDAKNGAGTTQQHDGDGSTGASAADPDAAPTPLPRDLSFLTAHVSSYQSRIESLLSYLHDHRFGRGGASPPALGRSAAELTRDVGTLEAEWATWRLVAEMRRAEEAAHETATETALNERYSAQLVAQRLLHSPASPQSRALVRSLHVLHWLEELHVFLLRIDGTGEVSWRRSLRRLQRSTAGDTQRDFLDPDVELRLRAATLVPAGTGVLDEQDLEEETRLLEYVWSLIRAGRLPEAIQLCKTYQAHWRAASLQGGERTHDEGAHQADGSVWRVGNPTRSLWRRACCALSNAPGAPAVERSIYGVLGGDLASALAFSGQHQYADALWCYLKIQTEEAVDEFVEAEGKGEKGTQGSSLRPAGAAAVPRDLAGVLDALSAPLNTLVTPAVHAQASQNPYIRLQKLLILGDYDAAEKEMEHTVRTQYRPAAQSAPAGAVVDPAAPTINHTYLLFAVHLYLYLHPLAPHSEPLNSSGIFLVQSYLSFLESMPSQHALVPSYVQYLPSHLRVEFFVRFLHRIPSLPARQNLLAAFEEYCPAAERLEVTRRLVENILTEESSSQEDATRRGAAASWQQQQQQQGSRRLLPGAGATGAVAPSGSSLLASVGSAGVHGSVSPSDLAKISAIDCFDVSSPLVPHAVLQEALVQVNALYRSFVSRDSQAAVRAFTQHLQQKQWDHHMYARMQQQNAKQEALPAEWFALDREYGHWKLYMRCLHWYDAWSTLHSAEPSKPAFSPQSYTHPSQAAQARAEYGVFARAYTRWEAAHAEWARSELEAVEQSVGAFKELLEQPDAGWMAPVAGSRDPPAMEELRRRCVPTLVHMLVHMCATSGQDELCLSIVDVLSAPLRSLHACFTLEQRRALMMQFRAAYIKVHTQQEGNGADEAGSMAQA